MERSAAHFLLPASAFNGGFISVRLTSGAIKLTMDIYGHLFEGSDKEAQTEEAAKSSKVLVFPARKKLA